MNLFFNLLKINTLFIVLSLLFSACGNTENSDTDNLNDSLSNSSDTSLYNSKNQGGIPFDFPKIGIESKTGDYVLTPGYEMWQNNISAEMPENETYIFYSATMSNPGEAESDIEFTFDGIQKMPNAIIVPIPSGQTAAKGDIVLTWWQTGSGMQRAIVTDATNPTEPMVRYLDLDYNNPATDNNSGKSIGQTDYQLKANSFVKISNEWQAGNMVAAKDENWGWVIAQIISIAENKVLTIGFAGKMHVYAKTDIIPMPIKPVVKKGDAVQVVGTSSFIAGTVVRVDEKIGRVFVKTATEEEAAIPYGEIILQLP